MSCSHAAFDGHTFARNAGLGIGGALISLAIAARQRAQAHADAIATDEALASWASLVEELAVENDGLRSACDTLQLALESQQHEAALLAAECATLRQRLADAGL